MATETERKILGINWRPHDNGTDDSIMCLLPSVMIDGNMVMEPLLIPWCILAAIIGWKYGNAIHSHPNTPGHLAYALSFWMYGTMMTFAMFVNCFFWNSQQWPRMSMFTGLSDVTLTSSIGLSFSFNGLVDVGWINENSFATKLAMFLSYTALFSGWMYTFLDNWANGFYVLYLGVITVSCGLYSITEIMYILRQQTHNGLWWLVSGAASGGVGISALYLAIANPTFFCFHFPKFMDESFWWFLFSDVSMYCLYKYYMVNKGVESRSAQPHDGQGQYHELIPRS